MAKVSRAGLRVVIVAGLVAASSLVSNLVPAASLATARSVSSGRTRSAAAVSQYTGRPGKRVPELRQNRRVGQVPRSLVHRAFVEAARQRRQLIAAKSAHAVTHNAMTPNADASFPAFTKDLTFDDVPLQDSSVAWSHSGVVFGPGGGYMGSGVSAQSDPSVDPDSPYMQVDAAANIETGARLDALFTIGLPSRNFVDTYPDGSPVLTTYVNFDVYRLNGFNSTYSAFYLDPAGSWHQIWDDSTELDHSHYEASIPGGAQAIEVNSHERFDSSGNPIPTMAVDNFDFMPSEPGGPGPTVVEQGGPPNDFEHQTVTTSADPVNTATGEFADSEQDVATIPGRGVPLSFTRTYSSGASATDGPLGYGWTDNWNPTLTIEPGGTVSVTTADGASVIFVPKPGGGYTSRALATLTANSDGTYTLSEAAGNLSYLFSPTGQLESETDLNGNATTLSYSSGQLSTVTEPAGRQLTFGYSGTHLTSVTDPLGRTTHFDYDTDGNLATVTDPMGRATTFTYDSSHQLLKVTAPRGGKLANVYNSSGQVISQTSRAGLTSTFAYSGDPTGDSGGTTTSTDPYGISTIYHYTDLLLTSLTRASGTLQAATFNYTYAANTGWPVSVSGPGYSRSWTYDQAGRPLTVATPSGTTHYQYDSLGDLTQQQLPAGETTNYTYDQAGNLLSETNADTKTTTFSHNSTQHPDDLTSVTDATGDTTSFGYNANGNQTSITTTPTPGQDRTSRAVYDADGEVVCQTTPEADAAGDVCPPIGSPRVGGTTTSTYDADGELTDTIDPLGHTSSATFDDDGNISQTTDSQTHVTTMTYDLADRVLSTTTGAGTSAAATTSHQYDLLPGTTPCASNIAGALYCSTNTDAKNRVTTRYYGDQGLMIAQTGTDNRTAHHSYDPAGNLTTVTDAAGNTATNTYDADNRLTASTYSDPNTPPVTYTYDSDNRRTSMVDGTGTTTYLYDTVGRIKTVTNGAGQAVTYGYDAAGRETTLTYPNGKQVTRKYDGAGQVASITDWNSNTTNFSYNRDGDLTQTNLPNGDTASAGWDLDSRQASATLASSGGTSLAELDYTRQANGMVTNSTETGALGATSTYGYDALDQLTSAGATSYSYDPFGAAINYGPFTQTFDNNSQVTSSTTANSTNEYTNDADGNRVQRHVTGSVTGGDTTYAYDQNHRLTAIGTGNEFTPVASTRIADTTTGSGKPYAGQSLGAGQTLDIQVAGQSPVPSSGVRAVVIDLVERTASAQTTLSVYPSGTTRPATTTLATGTAQATNTTRSLTNEATVPLGTGGKITVYNSAGTTNVAVDVVGYYAATGGKYVPIAPVRIADTRRGSGLPYASQTLSANASLTIPIAANNGVPSSATGAVVEVTAVNNSATGGVSVYPAGASAPAQYGMATLAGQPITKEMVVGLGTSGAVTLTNNSSSSTDLTVDLVGYLTQAGATQYVAVPTSRIVDTRTGSGNPYSAQSIPAGGTLNVQATGVASVPTSATAVVATITAVGSTVTTTALTAYSTGSARPATTNITLSNQPKKGASLGDQPANQVTVSLSPAGAFTVYNSSGTTDITVDILGYYTAPQSTATYNGEGLLAATHAGGQTTSLTWNSIASTPQLLNDGTSSYVWGPDGAPLEQIDANGTTTYFFHDQQGSTRVLTAQTGAVSGTYSYDAFGNTTNHTGTATTPLLYDGGYQTLSGLYYLINRYYDPTTGQFLTRDPLADVTGEPYGFAANDPVNNGDPSGLGFCLFGHAPDGSCWGGEFYDQMVTHYDPAYQALIDYHAEAEAYEQGCSTWTVIKHGLQGTYDVAALTFVAAAPVETAGAALTSDGAPAAATGAGTVLNGPIADAVPRTIAEQLALNAARDGQGTMIMRDLADTPRLVANYGPGEWVKMQYVLRGTDSNVVVHYFRNLTTNTDVEFKFK